MLRYAWLGFVIVCLVYVITHFNPNKLETNLFALLPEKTDDNLPSHAIDRYSETLSRKVVFLVSGNDADVSRETADKIYSTLLESELFDEIQFKLSEQWAKEIYLSYYPYRYNLLSPQDRAALQQQDTDLGGRLINAIVSPVASLDSATLVSDPFLLFRDFLQSLPRGNRHLVIEQGYPTIHLNGQTYLLISAELSGSPFDQSVQDRFVSQLAGIERLFGGRGVSIHSHGVVNYALENRKLAQREISVIGGGSLAGILLLFIFIYKKRAKLLIILLPVVVGMLVAIGVSLYVFDNIHLISLVFGVSLIGVSIDYAIHYSCANSNLTSYNTSHESLRAVRPALTLGMLSSVIGYATLASTNFPALMEMSVIAICGLVAAYLTVILWFPMILSTQLEVRRTVIVKIDRLASILNGLRKAPLWLVGLAVLMLLVVNIYLKTPEDNIKIMRASLPELEQTDQLFRSLLGEYPNNQFLLVSASTPDMLLDNEAKLLASLRVEVRTGGRYEGLSDWLPSERVQLENRKLIKNRLRDKEQLVARLSGFGIPGSVLSDYLNGFDSGSPAVMTIDGFLQSPAGKLHRDAWLGNIRGHYYSIVKLYGVDDLATVKKTAGKFTGVTYIDRAEAVSNTLGTYRRVIESVFPFVIIGIYIGMVFRFGVGGAVRVLGSPLLAAMTSFLCVLLLIGEYNIFTVFGLIITIAITIDYAIFVHETRSDVAATYLAILLAGCTTILAFGLLSLSQTPALRTFGLTLLLGILFSYVFTPFIVRSRDS